MSAAAAPAKAKWVSPDKFTGKPDEIGNFKGKEFIASLNLWFNHYDNDYGGAHPRSAAFNKERVLFALSLCSDAAFPWADIYIQELGTPTTSQETQYLRDAFSSWEEWVKQFNAHWHSMDEKESATQAVSRLNYNQWNSIVMFAGTFKDLAARTGWNNEAKQTIFKEKLPGWLQSAMANNVSQPANFEEWISWVIKLGQSKEADFSRKQQYNQGSSSAGRGTWSGRSRGRGSFGNSSFNRGFNSSRGRGTGFSNNTQRSSLDPAKRAEYIREQRCFKCGEIGHRQDDPVKHPISNTWQRNNNQRPANTTKQAGSSSGKTAMAATLGEGSGHLMIDEEGEEVNVSATYPRRIMYHPSESASSWRSGNHQT